MVRLESSNSWAGPIIGVGEDAALYKLDDVEEDFDEPDLNKIKDNYLKKKEDISCYSIMHMRAAEKFSDSLTFQNLTK